MLAHGPAASLFQPGNHGTTFGGNPLAMRAALTTLEVMERDGLVARAEVLGERLRQGFEQALADTKGFTGMQGKGLMIGIGLDRPCGALVKRALDEGLVINVTAERVVRLLPPLILSDAEADELVQRLVPLSSDSFRRDRPPAEQAAARGLASRPARRRCPVNRPALSPRFPEHLNPHLNDQALSLPAAFQHLRRACPPPDVPFPESTPTRQPRP